MATQSTLLKPPLSARVSPAPAVTRREESHLSPLGTLIGVITRPAQTFRRLRTAPRSYWGFASAVTIGALALSGIASASGRLQSMAAFSASGSDAAQQMQTPSMFSMIGLTLAGGVALMLLDYAAQTLVAFIMGMVLGGKLTFKQAFRMSVWTTIPYIVRHLVQSAAMFATGGQAVTGLSGAMTTAEMRAAPILSYVLGYVDFYMLWSAVLLGIGVAVTASIGRGKALMVVITYLAVALGGLLLIYASSNALGSLLGGSTGGISLPGVNTGGGGPGGGMPGGGPSGGGPPGG